MNIYNLTYLAALAGLCIGTVNIIAEVLKKCFLKSEASRPWAVVAVSEVVTFFAIYAYASAADIKFDCLMIAGGVMGGFFVSYGAMFGYDKLYGEFIKSAEKFLGEIHGKK